MWGRKHPHQLAVGLLALLTFLVFGDLLFRPGRIISDLGTDLSSQFLLLRQFGFGEMRSGNLPLWNPHLYSGVPFLAGFQSALFYPPNWLHLILPLGAAINLLVALHVFAAGAFMYWWGIGRGLSPVNAFFAGVAMMFSGAFFLHITPGHLSNLSTMPWAVLLFGVLDRYLQTRDSRWVAAGAGVVALQIFAGHPQYVYYTALAAGMYVLLNLLRSSARLRVAGGFAAMYLLGAGLAAVQLLPGLASQEETVRGTRQLSRLFLATCSFPPENFLTILVPDLFGHPTLTFYWGRWLHWEVTLFVGAVGLLLAIAGAWKGAMAKRWIPITMAVFFAFLALGTYSPLFDPLCAAIPGFSSFRGQGKFVFVSTLFLALLAGYGVDALLRGDAGKLVRWLAAGIAGALGLAALVVWKAATDPAGLWSGVVAHVIASAERMEALAPLEIYRDPAFAVISAQDTAIALLVTAVVLAVAVAALWVPRSFERAVLFLVAVGVAELFLFARMHRPTFTLEQARNSEIRETVRRLGHEYRLLQTNSVMADSLALLESGNAWGDDPMLLRRYAEFLAHSQRISPADADQDLFFSDPLHPFLPLLGVRTVLGAGGDPESSVTLEQALPRLVLASEALVGDSREEVFALLENPGFDPSRTVVLETTPEPAPTGAANPGTAAIVAESSDHLEIEAELSAPAVLVVRDSYAEGWHAVGLKGSSQTSYQVLPANYTLRAISLKAGYHRLRLEYRQKGLAAGAWISAVTAFFMAGGMLWNSRRNSGASGWGK